METTKACEEVNWMKRTAFIDIGSRCHQSRAWSHDAAAQPISIERLVSRASQLTDCVPFTEIPSVNVLIPLIYSNVIFNRR